MTDVSLSDSEFVTEVREALGEIDSTKIPDATIKQTKTRLVVPLLNDITGSDPDQTAFDNAAIYWTAEKAFDAWLKFTRVRDEGIEAYIDPDTYAENLEERTNNALFILDATRPPDIPNTVITVKYDGDSEDLQLTDWPSEREW